MGSLRISADATQGAVEVVTYCSAQFHIFESRARIRSSKALIAGVRLRRTCLQELQFRDLHGLLIGDFFAILGQAASLRVNQELGRGRVLLADTRHEKCRRRRLALVPHDQVAESGRLRPSGAAGANFLGGAVWGVFRENANCGDPPG